jgi:hypothetical protein
LDPRTVSPQVPAVLATGRPVPGADLRSPGTEAGNLGQSEGHAGQKEVQAGLK